MLNEYQRRSRHVTAIQVKEKNIVSLIEFFNGKDYSFSLTSNIFRVTVESSDITLRATDGDWYVCYFDKINGMKEADFRDLYELTS